MMGAVGTLRTAPGPLLSVLLGLPLACGGPADPGDPAWAGHGLVPLPADDPTPSEGALSRALGPQERTGYHSFGEVPDRTEVSHTWHLLNTEAVPVTVRKVTAPCTCTVPSVRWVDEHGEVTVGHPQRTEDVITVPPGEVLELSIRIDTGAVAKKNLPKLEVLNVVTDSPHKPYVTLEANLLVVADFQTTPKVLDLGRVGRSGVGRGELTTVAFPERTARIVGPLDVPEDLRVETRYEPVLDRNRWITTISLRPPHDLGRLERSWTMSTELVDGSAGQPYEMRLEATIAPDVEVLPPRLYVRGAEAGLGEIQSHVDGQRLRVVRVEVRGDAAESLRLEHEPRHPDADGRSSRWILRLSPLDGGGQLRGGGVVVIDLDDPQVPRLEVPYVLLPPR